MRNVSLSPVRRIRPSFNRRRLSIQPETKDYGAGFARARSCGRLPATTPTTRTVPGLLQRHQPPLLIRHGLPLREHIVRACTYKAPNIASER